MNIAHVRESQAYVEQKDVPNDCRTMGHTLDSVTSLLSTSLGSWVVGHGSWVMGGARGPIRV